MKPAVRSALAQADVEAALDYFCSEAAHAAVGFTDAVVVK